MFCQACGLQNSEGARFCNMCGARIAAAGTPGGAVPAPTQLGVAREGGGNAPQAQPQAGSGLTGVMTPQVANNTTSVSLEAIGVRTAKQTWTMVGIAAVLFAILGVAGTYFAMRHGQPQTGAAAPEDPFTVGAPTVATAGPSTGTSTGGGTPSGTIPEGEAPPEGLPQPSAMSSDHGEAAHPSGHPSATSQAGQGTSPTSAMHEATGAGATSMQTESTSAMDSAGTSTDATGAMNDATGTDTAANGTGGETAGTDASGSDPDLEMEMYSGRVRYLVRRYYMASATRCFDHATANNPSLHGQVVVAITIGTNGYVSDASVVRNSTGDDTLGACLAGQARTWRLSPPPGGESIQMNMPFSR